MATIDKIAVSIIIIFIWVVHEIYTIPIISPIIIITYHQIEIILIIFINLK